MNQHITQCMDSAFRKYLTGCTEQNTITFDLGSHSMAFNGKTMCENSQKIRTEYGSD